MGNESRPRIGRTGTIVVWTVAILWFMVGAGTAWACQITQITPNSGLPGQILDVTLEGRGFGFVQVKSVEFGDLPVEILDPPPTTPEPVPDSLRVQVNISPDTPPGPRDVVVTGVEFSCSMPGGFTVQEKAAKADLSVTKTASPSPVGSGQMITYTITVTNNGPDPATDVSLIEILPDIDQLSLELPFVTSQGTCSLHSGSFEQRVNCNLGNLPVGATATLTIRGVVLAKAGDTLSNSAVVNGNEEDPNFENSNAQTETSVTEAPQKNQPEVTIDRVIWNGSPSNVGEVEAALPPTLDCPASADIMRKFEDVCGFLNVWADFNGDGVIASYTTPDGGEQPEWLAGNIPMMKDESQTVRLGVSFPIVDPRIDVGESFDVGGILTGSPVETPPTAAVPMRRKVVGTTQRLVVSPGKEAPIPSTLTPDEVRFDVSIFGVPLGEFLLRLNVPDIAQKPNECAPTSTANSLRWLAKKHGFNDKLPSSDSDLVKDLVKAMKTSSTTGTSDEDMVNGKKSYIKDKKLPLTVEAQDDEGASGATKTKPTAEFLIEQLKKGQDVEIGFTFTGGGGHWVTAVGVVRMGGKLGVYINDPDDNKSGARFYELVKRSDGFLELKGYGKHNYIDIIVAESPKPLAGGNTIEQALDANGNGLLDDDEIQTAIQLWIRGEPVPGTDGQIIDDAKIIELIRKWIRGEPLSGASSAQNQSLEGPEPLSVQGAHLRPTVDGFALEVQGQGIRRTRLEVFDMAGRRLLTEEAEGNRLRFAAVDEAGRRWANGVYLYLVTVYGEQGQVRRSAVRKLMVLR